MLKLCKNYYRAASLPTAPLKKSHLIFGLSSLSLNEAEPVNASNHFNKVSNYSVKVFDPLVNFNIKCVHWEIGGDQFESSEEPRVPARQLGPDSQIVVF